MFWVIKFQLMTKQEERLIEIESTLEVLMREVAKLKAGGQDTSAIAILNTLRENVTTLKAHKIQELE